MAHDVANAVGPARPPTSGSTRTRPITLTSRLVRYEDAPDRRTIHPPGLSEDARMSTWISADSDAFVDLDATR